MERADDDVAFGLENRAWARDAMRSRVPAVLARVGLAGFEPRTSSRLSGGEQQRLAIAGALAPEPSVLVLDEPTANLDPGGCAAVFGQLARLRSEGATIVLVEHRVELAWPIADRVLALGGDGAPIDYGVPAAVLARSRDRLERAGIWLPDGSPMSPGEPANGVHVPTDGSGVVSAGPAILRFEAVRFGYGSRDDVLDGIDLAIRAGERIALVGPNGSGKTTLLRLGLGLLRPNAGRVELEGHDPAHLPPARLARSAGYVVQDPELGFVADTVAEEVTLGLEGADRDRAIALAAQLDLPLDRFAERSPYRLSGGEQRRLSLVTAFARRPSLLALDEPTYGQDRHGHEALVAALGELAGEETAMIAATHDERFVRDAAARRVELAAGRIVADVPIRPSSSPARR
jgi:energy-coupling factor transport system ATP-binding protein